MSYDLEIGRYLSTPTGLLVSAAIRIVFGGLLLTAAATSRAPNLLRVFGAAILILGRLTPVFGPERARRSHRTRCARSTNSGT